MHQEQHDIAAAKKEQRYWRKWYVGLMVVLLVQIVLYYFITLYFN